MSYHLVMERILWSVTLHFKYVVEAIKESKDLNEVSINELQASLAAWASLEFKEVCNSHWVCIAISIEHDDQGGNVKQNWA